MEPDTADQVRQLMSKGFAGTVFLTTDNVDEDYLRLSEAGVEFTMEPTDMPYGRDCGLRDPSGNQLRLAQLAPQFAAG
jgi:uncharacterized glyoxalase superfamily protein PhnB